MFKCALNNCTIFYRSYFQFARKFTQKSYFRLGIIIITTPQKYPICCGVSLQNVIFYGRIYPKRSFHFNLPTKYVKLGEPESQFTQNEIKKLDGEEKNDVLELKLNKHKVGIPPKNVLTLPSDNEEVDIIAPPLRPTFNIAAYADKSETLKHFIHLGVEIAKWEKHMDACFHILQNNIEDLKPYIFFLHNLGIPANELGRWLTVNPLVFQESLENLYIRINYLKSKKFNKAAIATILKRTPLWINYSITILDHELGVFQKKFHLTNEEVRFIAVSDPKLILFSIQNKFYLERQIKCIEAQMGFTLKEQKKLLLEKPRIYRTTKDHLISRFNVLHNEMELSHKAILQSTVFLSMRAVKLLERHRFLKFIGKNQYDPTKPNYISPKDFVGGSDAEFCGKIPCSIDLFNNFVKTL